MFHNNLCRSIYIVVPGQVGKMRAELASLNHCTVLFLSRTGANLCWYYYRQQGWNKAFCVLTNQCTLYSVQRMLYVYSKL